MLKTLIAVFLLPFSIIMSLFSFPVEKYELPEIIKEEAPYVNQNQVYDKINGNGCEFYITRPVPDKLNVAYSSDFGMSEQLEDNTDALNLAFAYCRDNPGTKLVIDKGVYRFSLSGKLALDKLDTCFIDGSNAKFVFSQTGQFFSVSRCNCVEIYGLTIDVDRVNNPVDDVAEVKNVNKKINTFDFVFFEKEDVSPNMEIQAISQCDPETLTFGAKGSNKENYIYMSPENIVNVEKISGNVLRITHDGALSNYADGDRFIIRHHVYDGQVFSVNAKSENITFNGLKIYGGYGSGFGGGDLANHYQIINTVIGVDPDDKTGAHVSLGADAIHIANSGGFFNLENCDISGQGDDALNIHDGLGYVYDVSGNTLKMYASACRLNAGEDLAFKDTNFVDMNYSAKIISSVQGDDCSTSKVITFDKDISDVVTPGCIAYNAAANSGNYVIRNNYFHENRARALLLQSDNGLCENNRFYKTEMQAIKIVMDIRPTLWQEGTGVNNLIIRNNIFEMCDYINEGEQITIDTYIDGHTAECYAFKNIQITGNSFSDFTSKLIKVMNVNGLDFSNNKIEAKNAGNYIEMLDYCENIKLDNQFIGVYSDIASVVRGKFKNIVSYNKI